MEFVEFGFDMLLITVCKAANKYKAMRDRTDVTAMPRTGQVEMTSRKRRRIAAVDDCKVTPNA